LYYCMALGLRRREPPKPCRRQQTYCDRRGGPCSSGDVACLSDDPIRLHAILECLLPVAARSAFVPYPARRAAGAPRWPACLRPVSSDADVYGTPPLHLQQHAGTERINPAGNKQTPAQLRASSLFVAWTRTIQAHCYRASSTLSFSQFHFSPAASFTFRSRATTTASGGRPAPGRPAAAVDPAAHARRGQ